MSEPGCCPRAQPRDPPPKALDSANGTIYNYFSSKEELLLAVVEEACARAIASAPARPVASARERLRATLATCSAWANADQGFALVLVRECLVGGPEVGSNPALDEIPEPLLRSLPGARLPAESR